METFDVQLEIAVAVGTMAAVAEAQCRGAQLLAE
jgi:hypothetical protein